MVLNQHINGLSIIIIFKTIDFYNNLIEISSLITLQTKKIHFNNRNVSQPL